MPSSIEEEYDDDEELQDDMITNKPEESKQNIQINEGIAEARKALNKDIGNLDTINRINTIKAGEAYKARPHNIGADDISSDDAVLDEYYDDHDGDYEDEDER